MSANLRQLANFIWSVPDARALVVTREVGAMNNATWRDINKVDTLAASHGLKKLRDAGPLQQQGRGSAAWCQPTAKLVRDEGGVSSNPEALSSIMTRK